MGLLKGTAVAVLLAAASTFASGNGPAPVPDSSVLSLAVPGRSNAYPSAASHGPLLVVAWAATTADGSTDVYGAISRDGGLTFGAPVRVNDGSGDVRISGEQPPRVALVSRPGREDSIVIVWTAKGPQGSRLLHARSDDGGRTYGRAAPVPGSQAAGNRGWESTAVDGSGRIVAAWLDHRELATGLASAAMSHHDGQAHTGRGDSASSVSRAQLSKLYVAPLDGSDPDARIVAAGVCYCCKTALASGPDGALYAAWRHVYPGNVRDIAFSVSRDGGRTFGAPVRVSEDRWVLDGCPENGPAVAVDVKNRIHVVWPTLVQSSSSAAETSLALFYASSRDGSHFEPRQRIPSGGAARHPQIAALADGTLGIAWDETIDGTRTIALARATVGADDVTRIERVGKSVTRQGTYPVVVAGSRILLAWTNQGSPTVIRLESMRRFD